MNSSEASGRVKLKGRLAKLPRIKITSRPAPNERAAQAADMAFEIRSAADVSKAFEVKRHIILERREKAR